MHRFLVDELKFKSCPHDPCLYMRHEKSEFLIVALYVDDLEIANYTKSDIRDLKKSLSEKFEIKDLGPANVMLGIEILFKVRLERVV